MMLLRICALCCLSCGVFAQAPPQFLDAGWLPAMATTAEGVALGDLDGDGIVEAVLATRAGTRLYENDGRGRFVDVSSRLPNRTSQTISAALGDVDGDGDTDILVGGPGVYDHLFLNDGMGGFSDASQNLPQKMGGSPSVVLADFDGDGDLDLLRGEGSNGLFLLDNDGRGVFTVDPGAMPSVGLLIFNASLTVADLDGDGDLDVVAGDTGPFAATRIYTNDGTGTFADRSATSLPAGAGLEGRGTFAGDVDGDGDVDLAVAASIRGARVFLNDGRAVFVDATTQNLRRLGPAVNAVGGGDLDEDGDVDLLFAVSGLVGPAPDRLLVNDGSGRFAEPAVRRLLGPSRLSLSVGIADVDGDGDLDALVSTGLLFAAEPDHLYVNRHRHLQTVTPPVTGGRFAVRFLSAPGYGAGPGVALSTLSFRRVAGPIPAGPFGTRWIAPVLPQPLPWAVIPQQTAIGITSVPVPANPALVNSTVYVQALIVDVFGLTAPHLTGFTADVIR